MPVLNKPMQNIGQMLAITCCCLILSTCSRHTVYPDNWKPLPKNPPENCVLPTGLYHNLNERGNVHSSSQLHYVFDLKEGDHIRLQLSDQGILTAQAIRHGEIIDSKTYDAEGEKPVCKNGWLLFKSRGWESGQAGFGYETSVTGLLVHDDYLVVKSSGSFTGWVYAIPFAASGSSWSRFRYIGDLDLEMLRREAQQLRERGYLED
jgi:hypothetical protein